MDGWTDIRAYRVMFAIYALLGLGKLLLSLLLSPACEVKDESPQRHDAVELGAVEAQGLMNDNGAADEEITQQPNVPTSSLQSSPLRDTPRVSPKSKSYLPQISQESRSVLVKLCLLFAVDSMASGLGTWNRVDCPVF